MAINKNINPSGDSINGQKDTGADDNQKSNQDINWEASRYNKENIPDEKEPIIMCKRCMAGNK